VGRQVVVPDRLAALGAGDDRDQLVAARVAGPADVFEHHGAIAVVEMAVAPRHEREEHGLQLQTGPRGPVLEARGFSL
jgi:hypothetical protein